MKRRGGRHVHKPSARAVTAARIPFQFSPQSPRRNGFPVASIIKGACHHRINNRRSENFRKNFLISLLLRPVLHPALKSVSSSFFPRIFFFVQTLISCQSISFVRQYDNIAYIILYYKRKLFSMYVVARVYVLKYPRESTVAALDV